MKRTNVYLDEEELRALKHIAVEEGLSFTELVRRALSIFTEAYRKKGLPPWEERIDSLIAQVRARAGSFPAPETERDVSAASAEVRSARKHAPRRR
jgi:hypothetical protein